MNRSLSTVVIAILLTAFIVGHVIYGWNLYLTLESDGNFWAKTPFLFASVVWIAVSIILLVFAWDLWKERKTDRKHEVMTLGKPQKEQVPQRIFAAALNVYSCALISLLCKCVGGEWFWKKK